MMFRENTFLTMKTRALFLLILMSLPLLNGCGKIDPLPGGYANRESSGTVASGSTR